MQFIMRRSSDQQSSIKKHVRDTYAHRVSLRPFEQSEKIKIQKINSIAFGQDAMILTQRQKIIIYSLINMKPFFTKNGFFWDAVFIPNTSLIAVVQHDGTKTSKRTLKIIDIDKDQNYATVVIKFQIQSIKATQHCICLVGEYEISVIHFPTLKPICHQLAGSGLGVIYDISYEGLTLAYNNQKKGAVIVHNFSSISTIRARRKSIQTLHKKSAVGSMLFQPYQQPKKIVEIKAHLEFVSLIRISPNGNRIATASQKGTMIRIFLTESGKLWQQLRIGYQISKILDMNFYEEGNVISCVTEKNMVYLFNTKLESEEQMAENQKRGYKIYQQSNPKSIFTFLSFFYSNFANQYPFAYYKLVKPQQGDQNKKTKEDKAKDQDKVKDKQIQKQKAFMSVILQQAENVALAQSQHQKKASINSGQVEQPKQQPQPQPEPDQQQQPQPELSKPKKQTQIQIHEKIERSDSISSSLSDVKSRRSQSLMRKINAIQGKKENYQFIAPVFNTISRVFVGGNNFVWVVKGSYLFSLKYDPFNGGEMHHQQTLKFY